MKNRKFIVFSDTGKTLIFNEIAIDITDAGEPLNNETVLKYLNETVAKSNNNELSEKMGFSTNVPIQFTHLYGRRTTVYGERYGKVAQYAINYMFVDEFKVIKN
jgi:hypothetical protein